MSKTLKTDNFNSHPMVRTLVAVSLSVSLAAFGCTTDRHLGNGDPVTTPGLRTSPTGSTSSGSETPSVPPPMFSSSFDNGQALPVVRARASRADKAAAVVAEQQPRVRYLGVTMPGAPNRPYASDGIVTGAFQNPALRTNPQVTVNSSISSQPTQVVASGAGEGGGGDAVAAGVFVNSTTATGASVATGASGATGGSIATGTGLSLGSNVNSGAAPIFASPATAGTATGTALPLGTLAATATPTASPTAFALSNPPTAISGFPALATNNAPTATTNGTAITSPSTATATSTATGTTGGVRNPVRITRDANGRVTITNTSNQR